MALRTMMTFVACVALTACMSQAETATVEAAAAQFHALQARGDDNAIYQAASPNLRAASRLEDLARLNLAVRQASGCSAPERNTGVLNNQVTTSGHFITVSYHRQCSGGPIDETFRFSVNGGQALLVSYNVTGMALFPTAPPAQPAPEAAPKPTTPATQPT